jgi:hypothetical protein
MQNDVGVSGATRPFSVAVELMWLYYKANKPSLIADIPVYREYILAQLMAGHSEAEVFARFMRAQPAAPCAASARKHRTLRNRAAKCRTPWPFSTT